MIASLYERMKERLGAVPGVRSVSLSEMAFLSGGLRSSSVHFQGQEVVEGQSSYAHMMIVSPEFFETMQIPVLAGRAFDASDDADASRVAMINDTAARQLRIAATRLQQRPLGECLERRQSAKAAEIIAASIQRKQAAFL